MASIPKTKKEEQELEAWRTYCAVTMMRWAAANLKSGAFVLQEFTHGYEQPDTTMLMLTESPMAVRTINSLEIKFDTVGGKRPRQMRLLDFEMFKKDEIKKWIR